MTTTGTRATVFAEREHQICAAARLLEDGKNYWVAGGGSPLYTILLAQRMGYTPNANYITEDGAIGPRPQLPFDPIMTMVAARAGYRALQWGTMNTAGNHAALGFMDYGILNTLQVDRHGNINSTFIGEYPEGGRRFGGPGGADTIAAECWRTILLTDQEKRKFVERVDFISSPGFLDGSEGARERAGMPAGTGPWRVVTPLALWDYEERELRLLAVSPWVTVEQVLAECSFKPRVAPEVGIVRTPTEEELHILRTELDVRGQNVDAGGGWITLEDKHFEIQDRARTLY